MAVIDAKHNGFYVCGYNNFKVTIPPSYIMKEDLLQIKDGYKLLSFEEINDLEVEVVSVAKGLEFAIEKKKKEVVCAKLLQPLYVRKSQAEEGR